MATQSGPHMTSQSAHPCVAAMAAMTLSSSAMFHACTHVNHWSWLRVNSNIHLSLSSTPLGGAGVHDHGNAHLTAPSRGCLCASIPSNGVCMMTNAEALSHASCTHCTAWRLTATGLSLAPLRSAEAASLGASAAVSALSGPNRLVMYAVSAMWVRECMCGGTSRCRMAMGWSMRASHLSGLGWGACVGGGGVGSGCVMSSAVLGCEGWAVEYDVGVRGVGLVGDCVACLSAAGKFRCRGGRDVGAELWAWVVESGGEMSVSQVCWLPGRVVIVCVGVLMSVSVGGGVC